MTRMSRAAIRVIRVIRGLRLYAGFGNEFWNSIRRVVKRREDARALKSASRENFGGVSFSGRWQASAETTRLAKGERSGQSDDR